MTRSGGWLPLQIMRLAMMRVPITLAAPQLGMRPRDWRALVLLLFTLATGGRSAMPADANASAFSDVDEGHPFDHEIAWMAEAGIPPAIGWDAFRPSARVTRMAMSALMYRLAGEPAVTGSCTSFGGDVVVSHPFCNDIVWMAEAGISTGYRTGRFVRRRT